MRIAQRLIVPGMLLLAACTAGTDDGAADSESQAIGGHEGHGANGAKPPAKPAEPPASKPPAPPAAADVGAVFTISNDAVANEVVAFPRGIDGSLGAPVKTATGGKGAGKGLGSQGALAKTADGKHLLVVDAGSNEITSFAVDGTKLTVRSRVSSHGTTPVSIAIRGDLVYVLNAGDTACISGYRLSAQGELSFLEGSKHSLSTAAAGPAQISFSPTGDALVVTEKATNVIDTFTVGADGLASNGEALPSSGMTPFGFAFTNTGAIVVSEAFGGMPGAGAVSSYRLAAPHANGAGGTERDLVTVSASVKTAQGAPCWVVVTKDGRTAFVSNTASGTISSFGVAADGSLALVGNGASGVTGEGTKPADMSLDRNGKRLYVLDGGTHDLSIFDIGAGGALVKHAETPAVPMTAAGLVAE